MSGIYIKDIKMPKDGEYPYLVIIRSDGTIEYNENKGEGWKVSKCIPVSDHGDLIDKDETMNAILGEPTDVHYPSWYAGIVNEQPAVIPVYGGNDD